jgi:hypothetical protein
LRAGAGVILGALAAGESATYRVIMAAQDFSALGDDVLNFLGFIDTSTDPSQTATIAVSVDTLPVGTAFWGGPNAPNVLLAGASNAGTQLDVTFTASASNTDVFFFSGSEIQANPEPATMVLLGLGMSLVGGGYWRSRRKGIAPATSA